MMRKHTLQVIGNKKESDLIEWGNSVCDPEHKIESFNSKSLSTSIYFFDILKSIEPRAINWDIVHKEPKDDAEKESNAKYVISVARKLDALVFIVWEDITDVKKRMMLLFLSSLYDLAHKYKKSD